MQQKYKQKPPNIVQSLSRAFLQKENTLVIHSKGLDVCHALAMSLYLQKAQLVILVDFDLIQIQQINYYLHEIKQQRLILADDIRADRPEITNLNKSTKQKRKKCYLLGGIYSLTTQIMLLDCLSETQELNPHYISRVIIKDIGHKLNQHYDLVVWLTTLLSLDLNSTSICMISNRAHNFRGQNLQKIFRLMYMKKLVLWPFGRSQIHESLKHKCPLNRNHKLSLNIVEVELHRCLNQLLKYCSRQKQRSITESNDRRQIQYLSSCLLNYNKIDFLINLEKIILQSGEYSIWKSSNTSIIELIDQIVKFSRNCVYNLLLSKTKPYEKEGLLLSQHSQQIDSQSRVSDSQPASRRIDLNSLIYIKKQNKQKEQQEDKDDKDDKDDKQEYPIFSKPQSIQMDQSQSNSQKSSQPPFYYNLIYDLHIVGLESCNKIQSPLFPVKLVQIIKYIQSLQIFHRNEAENQEYKKLGQMLVKNTNKGGSLSKQQIIHQENQQDVKLQKGDKQVSLKTTRNEQKQMRQKEEVSQKKQNNQQSGNTDFQKYEFSKSNTYSKNSKHQEVDQKRKNTNIRLFSQCSTHQIKQESKAPQRQLDPFCQPQRMVQKNVYISTNNNDLNSLLHYHIFCYQNSFQYYAYTHRLQQYLSKHNEQRVAAIMRIMKKYSANPSNYKPTLMDQQAVLLQQLYLEIRKINRMIEKFSMMRMDTVQADYLFSKQIQRIQCRYVDKNALKLWTKDYNPKDDGLIQQKNKKKIVFFINSNHHTAELNQHLRVLSPSIVFFYTPNTAFIRHLNIEYSQQTLYGFEQLHAVYFNNSSQSEKVVKIVKEQDEAFWGIAQQRKKLGEYKENAQIRIKQLIIDDQISKKARMINLAAATQAKIAQNASQARKQAIYNPIRVERTIIIDKRQFKSMLPSYLYHHGFKIIPIFLQNADYILSNDVAIEKKSVHTKDLHQSLKSGRLGQQIRRLCSKFSYPYLLIQCPDISYFRKQQFNYGYNKTSGDKYSVNVRKQLVQLMCKYPKINIIWSTSYMETVKHFIQLKNNRQEPDLNKFKPQSDVEDKEIQMLEEEGNSQNINEQQF